MTRFVSTDDPNVQRWIRSAALAINSLIPSVATIQGQVAPLVAGHPFQQLAAAPASPTEGQTYYDTVLHKTRTWDGAAWQNHW